MSSASGSFWKSPPVAASVAALAGVILFEVVMARGGGEPGQAVLFLGRFHPLVVHLPIGIWVLVALAEGASLFPRFKPRVDPALQLALPLLLACTVGAFVLGHLLGKAGGFPPHALTLHRRLEFLATIGTSVTLLLFSYQARAETSGARLAYRGVLAASIGLLSIGAHFGGTLTRGDTYLSKYAPGFLKPMLGGEEPKAAAPPAPPPPSAEPLLYANVVHPLLDKYCVECHHDQKRKGKLRLDTLAGLQKGGENGAAISPGSSESSLLIKRMLLPASDDDHMPPADEAQPSADEIAVLRVWIDRGAGDALRVRDMLPPEGARKVLLNSIAPGTAPAPAPAEAPAPEPAAVKPAAPSASAEPKQPKEPAAAEPAAAKPEPPVVTSLSGPAILDARCGNCHGANKQKGKLRVDSLAALLRGGKHGPALVPGSPDQSSIIQRLRLPLSDDRHMPPSDEPQLSSAEVAALNAWVKRQSASPPPAQVAREPAAAATEPAAVSATQHEAPTVPASTTVEAAPAAAEEDNSALLASLPPTVHLWTDAVQPILQDKCGKCHSGAAPKADLDVSSVAKLKTGGWSGPGVVASKPADSLVLQRSKLPESDDDRMPPPGEPPIKQGEIDLVEAWVALGAAEGTTTETKTLSGPALEVLSATLRAPRARAAEHEKVEAKAGGCAACTIGDSRPLPFEALFVSLAGALALLLRRQRQFKR